MADHHAAKYETLNTLLSSIGRLSDRAADAISVAHAAEAATAALRLAHAHALIIDPANAPRACMNTHCES